MQKGFMALEEWNQLLLLYLLEFNDTSQNKISQQILKEIAEKIQPLFKSDREKLFGIKIIDDTNDIERPPDLRMQKNEEIHSKNIVKHVKYRKLTREESKNAIKCILFLKKFFELFFLYSRFLSGEIFGILFLFLPYICFNSKKKEGNSPCRSCFKDYVICFNAICSQAGNSSNLQLSIFKEKKQNSWNFATIPITFSKLIL